MAIDQELVAADEPFQLLHLADLAGTGLSQQVFEYRDGEHLVEGVVLEADAVGAFPVEGRWQGIRKG